MSGGWPSIVLLEPWWALLALLLPLVWWRNRTGTARVHRILRTAIFAAIVLALTQPVLHGADGGVNRVVLLDQKAALTEQTRAAARQALADYLARLPEDDRVTLVQLGGDPVRATVVRSVLLDDAASANSLSVALSRALDAIPLGTRSAVTLISDGTSADAHWARSVAALVERGIPVDALALPVATGPAFISDIAVSPARAGETTQARVTVEGAGRNLRVVLSGDEGVIARLDAFDTDGGAIEVALPFTATGEDFMPLSVTLAGGSQAGLPPLQSALAIQPPLRVLYLGGRQAGAAAQLRRLLGPGFDVATPGGTGAGLDFAAYDAVLLDDLPAARLPDAAQARLIDAVRNGGTGLLVSGGLAAFGSGGYEGTPLAAALPVTFRQQQRIERPGIALAVVIDSSSSMEGQAIQLAKQIAQSAVADLTARDQVGVVEFYGAQQWAVPMQPADDTATIERAISRMQAQGSSVLLPAMQEAYYGLVGADARYKHMLVISDGDVSDGAFEQLIRFMNGERITLSTVAISDRSEDYTRMMDWARWGNGRFYAVPDQYRLIDLDFEQPQSEVLPAYRSGTAPVRLTAAGRGWWAGARAEAPPPVAGFVPTDVRPAAQTLLETAGGEALLAGWQYGRGRINALTTEPLGAGTRPWSAWSGYGDWLGNLIARTAQDGDRGAIATRRTFDRLEIVVRTGGGGGEAPQVRIAGRDDPVVLNARAPGIFAGSVPFPSGETARITMQDGALQRRAVDRAFSDSAGGRPPSLRHALPLRQLASLTGGAVAAADVAGEFPLSRPDSGRNGAIDPIWPWLALLAILLYLAEIAYRRDLRAGIRSLRRRPE